MNLFGITSIPGSRVLRLPMSREIQDEVEIEFRRQEAAFRSGIEEEHEFDGRYRPEEGELLKISNFDDVDGLSSAVTNSMAVEPFDPSRHSISQLKAVFSGYTSNGGAPVVVLIQLFEQRRTLVRGLTMFFSNNTFQKMEHFGLSLDTKLLAIMDGPDLKFQSFHFLRRVFEVDAFARDASQEDLQEFLDNSPVAVANSATFIAQADSIIRRKIAFILQSGILANHTGPEIQEVARSFGIDIPLDSQNRLVLPENRVQLKTILRFLDEDYFESPISRTKFVSNSKRVVNP